MWFPTRDAWLRVRPASTVWQAATSERRRVGNCLYSHVKITVPPPRNPLPTTRLETSVKEGERTVGTVLGSARCPGWRPYTGSSGCWRSTRASVSWQRSPPPTAHRHALRPPRATSPTSSRRGYLDNPDHVAIVPVLGGFLAVAPAANVPGPESSAPTPIISSTPTILQPTRDRPVQRF